MNRLECQSDGTVAKELAAAREEGLVLGWDIIETYGVVVAVPHGTELIAEATVDALIQELRSRPPLVDAG
jgi:hypothetical protein